MLDSFIVNHLLIHCMLSLLYLSISARDGRE